ncbi:hypothetical protein BH09BAC6_BH09BAC6_13850 [soil metagenome]|jgi:hypothetical protein
MFLILLKITIMVAMLILPLYLSRRNSKKANVFRKAKKIRIPKDYNDTSEANYAINENGFLEEIHRKIKQGD